MPGPALLFLLRAAAATAQAVATGARAAALRLAAASNVLARAGARFAADTLRVARYVARSALRGSRAFLLKAYRALRFGAWLIRRLTREFVSRAISLFLRLRSQAERIYSATQKPLAQRLINLIRNTFADSVAQSQGEFLDRIEDALNNQNYDKSERLLAIDIHRQNVLKKYTDLVDFVLNNTQLSEDEIIDYMMKEVTPEVLAARVIATGDPTASLDVDAEEHIARMTAEFLAFLDRVRDNAESMNKMRLVQFLLDETDKASKAASFRQMLIAQLVRDKVLTDIDNVSFGALAQVDADDVDATVRALHALSTANLGSPDVERNKVVGEVLRSVAEISWKAGLTMINEFAVAAMRQQRIQAFDYLRIVRDARDQLRRINRMYQDHHVDEDVEVIDPRAMREADAELIDEEIAPIEPLPLLGEEEDERPDDLEEEEEDDITFGIWELNARRMTQYHCPDCEALASLTSFAPVPISQLPQPGTETECGNLCGCDIIEVDEQEHERHYQSWASIYKKVFEQDLPAKFDDIPRQIMSSMLHFMADDYDKAIKWARRLQIV